MLARVERRRVQAECIARGLHPREEGKRTGDPVDAADVVADLPISGPPNVAAGGLTLDLTDSGPVTWVALALSPTPPGLGPAWGSSARQRVTN